MQVWLKWVMCSAEEDVKNVQSVNRLSERQTNNGHASGFSLLSVSFQFTWAFSSSGLLSKVHTMLTSNMPYDDVNANVNVTLSQRFDR